MSRVYVVRSRVGQYLRLPNSVTIRPWCVAEVPVQEMVGDLRACVKDYKERKLVDVHLVIDGVPVDPKNETAALNPPVQVGAPVAQPVTDQRSYQPGSVVLEERKS